MSVLLIQGDARSIPLADKSIHCCVTSPPYWGLRDYGVEGQLGLEKTPDEYIRSMVEVFREVKRVLRDDGTLFLNMGDSYAGNRGNTDEKPGADKNRVVTPPVRTKRILRGARSSQNGLPCGTDGRGSTDSREIDSSYSHLCDGCRDAFLTHNFGTFQRASESLLIDEKKDRGNERGDYGEEVERDGPVSGLASTSHESSLPPSGECLHCDNCGVCLSVLNSWSRDGRLCARRFGRSADNNSPWLPSSDRLDRGFVNAALGYSTTPYLKNKDLCGIPWMLAFALRADGWYLRSDIIWSKPNPMPESVTDRPTKAHEYIFLLSKSERYYYNADASKENVTGEAHARGNGINPKAEGINSRMHQDRDPQHPAGRKQRCPKDEARDAVGLRPSDRFGRGPGWRVKQNESFSAAVSGLVERRNKRTVWEIATQPISEAHFATFPEELIKPCILAGCPEGGIVLDPFIGSGTTALVAQNLQCNAVGLELNAAYIEIAKRRLAQSVLEFTT